MSPFLYLYILFMCFVLYLSGIVCTMYRMYGNIDASPTLIFRQNFEEIFGIPPCAPGTYATVPGYTPNIVEFNYFDQTCLLPKSAVTIEVISIELFQSNFCDSFL